MFADRPPTAAHQTVAAGVPLSVATRRRLVRNLRGNVPQLSSLTDVQILDAAQQIADSTASRPSWAALHAQTQVLLDIDGAAASSALSLILGDLAPEWVAWNTARLTQLPPTP